MDSGFTSSSGSYRNGGAISRNNYEEFFLLYIDNELPAEEKQAVEEFINKHPDLEEELALLKDTMLNPDESIRFETKELLLKEEAALVNTNNYEEYFLLYVDGELNEQRRKATEEFAAQNPKREKELGLLKMSKLEADPTVVYPDKSGLYRTEKQPAKTVSVNIKWWRVAAAAVLFITAGLIWINTSPPDSQENAVAGIDTNKTAVPGTRTETVPESKTSNPLAANTNNNDAGNKKINGAVENKTHQPLAVTTVVKKQKNESGSNNSTEKKTEELNGQKGTETIVAVIPAETIRKTETITSSKINSGNPVAVNTVIPEKNIVDQPAWQTDVKNDYATQALLTENYGIEVAAKDEEPRERKGLFRSLTRKASRIFNKATNPDPDKPVVRIASFEIAKANK
ncbi:MAG: hypothetical protein SFU87_03545 [Chitinophagaceae bacterium]|nr:hypothetical protein [Chitinophagaceae bacterium]